MPQIQAENLPNFFRVPAGALGTRMSFPLPVHTTLDFTRNPLNLHARAAQVFIPWVLPFAFVAYYPTLRLLDKMNPPPPPSLAAPRTGQTATASAARVWRRRLISRQWAGS